MSYLLIDNTINLDTAKMTPLIINFFKKKNIPLIIISDKTFIDIKINENELIGIILSGGPILLSQHSLLKDYILNLTVIIKFPNIPILGICFGFQIISMIYGGYIDKLQNNKKGLFEDINIVDTDSMLFKNINKNKINVFQYHNDYIKYIPNDFKVTAKDNNDIIQCIENKDKLRFGTQFHPENSEDGLQLLNNFIIFSNNIFKESHP